MVKCRSGIPPVRCIQQPLDYTERYIYLGDDFTMIHSNFHLRDCSERHSPVCPVKVFVHEFEYECHCCGCLEWLEGLEYLSYDEHRTLSKECWDESTKWRAVYCRPQSVYTLEQIQAHPNCEVPPTVLPSLRGRRGMYFPYVRCADCERSVGHVVYCIQKVKAKGASVEHQREFIESQVSMSRQCLVSMSTNPSEVWPVDAPCWKLSWAGNVHFTSKYVGQAFFPCSCRSYPMGVFCKYPNYVTGKQIFYRCPYLDTAVGADQHPEVSEFVQQMGIDINEAEMSTHIASG